MMAHLILWGWGYVTPIQESHESDDWLFDTLGVGNMTPIQELDEGSFDTLGRV